MKKTNEPTVTYKQIRLDLAAKYRAKLEEIDKSTSRKLLDISLLRAPEERKEKKAKKVLSERRKLISNLQSELEKEEGYDKAKRAREAEIEAEKPIADIINDKKKLQHEYKEKLEELRRHYGEKIAELDEVKAEKLKAYEDAQLAYRGNVEIHLETDERFEALRGDREKILNALKKYYVTRKKAKVMGYKGEKVTIKLPAVMDSEGRIVKGCIFKCFVSDDSVCKEELKEKPELERRLHSDKDVIELLYAMNKFMAALGCETDGNMKYEKDLCYELCYFKNKPKCDALVCLRDITGLDYDYFVKNSDMFRRETPYAVWEYERQLGLGGFSYRSPYSERLLLRLQDKE